MSKREYIQANKDWLEAKSKEEGVKALPKEIYYKVLAEGDASSAQPTVRSIITAHYTGKTKPEYGSSRHILVKFVDGEIAVTDAHVGSLGDIITYPIDVEPDLNISKVQLLDAILHELSNNGFSESEESDFWSDFDNLQKAKIVR